MSNPSEGAASIPNPETFFLEAPLYKSFNWGNSGLEDSIRLEYFQGTFRAYCVECENDSIFRGPETLPDSPLHLTAVASIQTLDNLLEMVRQKDLTALPPQSLTVRFHNYILSDRVFIVTVRCQADRSHRMYFVFRKHESSITKIGQSPSRADIDKNAIKKYRKILGEEKFREFTRANGLFASGVGIGSFVYLRRIFENLIDEAHKEAKATPNWDDTAYKDAHHWDEEIEALAEFLPDFLVKNRRMYSLLSIGIHELSEEWCLEHFLVLKGGIELILDEKIEKTERAAKIAAIQKGIRTIEGKPGTTKEG